MTDRMLTDTLTCPKCQSPMRSYERSGITVDQCTSCQGIFLDRGELERLIAAEDGHYGQGSRYSEEHGGPGWGGQRRRRGFLGDLLDFG